MNPALTVLSWPPQETPTAAWKHTELPLHRYPARRAKGSISVTSPFCQGTCTMSTDCTWQQSCFNKTQHWKKKKTPPPPGLPLIRSRHLAVPASTTSRDRLKQKAKQKNGRKKFGSFPKMALQVKKTRNWTDFIRATLWLSAFLRHVSWVTSKSSSAENRLSDSWVWTKACCSWDRIGWAGQTRPLSSWMKPSLAERRHSSEWGVSAINTRPLHTDSVLQSVVMCKYTWISLVIKSSPSLIIC